MTPKDGAAAATRYVAVNVKKGDRWLISQLTETEAPAPTAYSQLQALEWLVGNWENKAGDQTVQTKIDWAGDKNFLVRKFNVKGSEQTRQTGGKLSGGIRNANRSGLGFSIAMEVLGKRHGPTTASTG